MPILSEFENNLVESGWTQTVSTDGLVNNYYLNGAKIRC